MAVATTIGQRFLQLIQHLGISKNAFAQSLEKTATVIQHLVDERNKPGYDLLCKVFEVYPNVSKDWLLLGQGPMLTAGSAAPALKESAAVPTLFTAASVPPAAAATVAEAEEAVNLPLPVPAQVPDVSVPDVPAEKATPAPEPTPAKPTPASEPSVNVTTPAPQISSGVTEAMLTAALHAQHLQHQLALAEQRNQHLLEQQRLMQQLLDFAQRR